MKKIIEIDEKKYKKIKKNKLLRVDVEDIKEYKSKDLVYFKCNNKIMKRKIKNVLDDSIILQKKLGILRIILVIILIIILFIICKKIVLNILDNRVKDNINKLRVDEISVVIVDINPSVYFKVKNNTIIDTKCLNEDRENVINNLDYDDNYTYKDSNGKPLVDIINLIYDEAQKQGYDTSNGITVSSSNPSIEVIVENINDATFNKIDVNEEMDRIKDVEDIKEVELTKKEYNNQLLNELQKDSDYNKTFSCSIIDDQVKCYMMEYDNDTLSEFGFNEAIEYIKTLYDNAFTFRRLLNKFDIKFNADEGPINSIYLNNKQYHYTSVMVSNLNDCNNVRQETITVYRSLTISKDVPNGIFMYLPFSKVELLTQTYDNADVIVVDGSKYCW